jgi:hypothetical protein
MLSLNDLAITYTQVIGGGGYGIVKTGIGDPYNKYAVKFLYASQCPSAKKEYISNKLIYSAYEIFMLHDPVPGVSVVKPYDFTTSNCTVNCNTDTYDCAVVMERLTSPLDYAVHLAFNGAISPSMMNKIIYADKIPRGYFFDPQHIESMLTGQTVITKLEDIIYRMGILDGISIFGARKIPVDAEYILTVSPTGLNVSMLDFGMFADLNVTPDNYQEVAQYISDQQELNLYYHPYSEAIPADRQQSCKNSYIEGFTKAYKRFDSDTYSQLYNALIDIYTSLPVLY